MSYGRNFGMRSFENVIRDARYRVPSTGTPLKIGAPVIIDAANPGKLKLAAATDKPSAVTGLAVFEHIQNKSDELTLSYDSPYDSVPLGVYAQMMHGVGVKVWFKNTTAKTLYDGRQRAAYSPIVDAVAADMVGKGLIPDGTGKWKLAGVGDTAWLLIEQANPTTGLVEARLTF